MANFVGPTSGGMKVVIDTLGEGYVAAGHERILVVPGRRDHVEETASGIIVSVRAPKLTPQYRMIAKPWRALEVLDRFRECSVLKVKVAEPSQSLAEDIERIATIRQLRPDATLRVDANRGWSVNEAIAAARHLGPLEYMEQPVATVGEMEELRRWVDVPIAADESIRKAEDPYEIARRRAADYAVIKVAPMGGVAQVERVAEFMAQHGMGIRIASALDTAVGMNSGVVAAATVAPEYAAGLATSQLFIDDVAAPREIVGGMISTAPVSPDPARLEELAAPPERRDWWLRRIAACWLELGL